MPEEDFLDEEEKEQRSILDTDSESKRAKIVLDSIEEEKIKHRKGESDLFNIIVLIVITVLGLILIGLLYYVFAYYEFTLPW